MICVLCIYDVEVICEARKILYEFAEKRTVDVPRPKVRKRDNKKKAEGKDLFEIFEILDKSSC